MPVIPICQCCGNSDHFMLGRNNEMRCAVCREYLDDEDYIDLTEEEYERWRNEKPERI